MEKQNKQTFLEKLALVYPGQFKVERTTRGIPSDVAIFPTKNKRFGIIRISGELHQWEDEADYDEVKFDDDNYCECGGDFQDYCEDISLSLHTKICSYSLTPTEIFECLEKIFDDKIVFYWTWKPWHKWKNHLYERSAFEKMLNGGKIRVSKNYKLCLWSGNYSIKRKV